MKIDKPEKLVGKVVRVKGHAIQRWKILKVLDASDKEFIEYKAEPIPTSAEIENAQEKIKKEISRLLDLNPDVDVSVNIKVIEEGNIFLEDIEVVEE